MRSVIIIVTSAIVASAASADPDTCPDMTPLVEAALDVRSTHFLASQNDVYDRCHALAIFGNESMRLVIEGVRLLCPLTLLELQPLIRLKDDGADRRALEAVLVGAYATDLQTGDPDRFANAYADQVHAVCILQGRR